MKGTNIILIFLRRESKRFLLLLMLFLCNHHVNAHHKPHPVRHSQSDTTIKRNYLDSLILLNRNEEIDFIISNRYGRASWIILLLTPVHWDPVIVQTSVFTLLMVFLLFLLLDRARCAKVLMYFIVLYPGCRLAPVLYWHLTGYRYLQAQHMFLWFSLVGALWFIYSYIKTLFASYSSLEHIFIIRTGDLGRTLIILKFAYLIYEICRLAGNLVYINS